MNARTCIALAAATLLSGTAYAAPLTANQMLQQFNVVVSGNLTSTSHVDGRSYVGLNANGGDYVQHVNDTPASAYAGLTVGGTLSGNVHVNGLGLVTGGDANGINVNSGASYVGGSASGSSFNGDAWIVGAANGGNFNGGIHAASYANINVNPGRVLAAPTGAMTSTLAASTSTNFGAVMTGLSSQLSAMHATDGTKVTYSNNDSNVLLSGKAVNGVLVFDLTKEDSKIFSSKVTDISFNLTGASTVIFNTDDSDLSLYANFNQAQTLGSKLIWNFAGHNNSVTVGRTFGGQVLVADGTFSNVGGANVEGGVFAKTLNQYGEIHLQSFTGTVPTAPVPEPETYAMLLAGLGVMGAMLHRRKKQG
ncbi:collagen-binding domain-containing protein [Duganella vulcania]|nr:collagen-binding domain-containing protein [Duganella vulcania]